jgi:hypothetical protein
MVHRVMNVSFQSAVSPDYRAALERLVFFNPRQHHARDAIVDALDCYGALAIANGPDGLGVTVSMRPDAQCLFIMVPRRDRVDLAGGLVYLRTSLVELKILHIAIAARYCARPRLSLDLVKHLLRTVRATAHRLRGIERVTVLYRRGRSLRLRPEASALRTAFVGDSNQRFGHSADGPAVKAFLPTLAEPVEGSARALDVPQSCSSAA